MEKENQHNAEIGIDRRTTLKVVGAAGLGLYSFTGAAQARGTKGGGPPGQSCDCEEGDFIAKYDFECVEYDDGECVEEECVKYECAKWDFILAEGMDVVDITVTETKYEDDDSEPITVEFEADGYVVQSVCAYGGRDTDSIDDEGGVTEFATDLTNPGGQQAAISNITFCGVEAEDPFPQCPFYGTTMGDPTEVQSIRWDPDAEEIVTAKVADIPNGDPGDSARPNGLAFDDANDIWYFADRIDGTDGVLSTLNEDGNFGVIEYEDITSGDAGIAGAAYWDAEDEYLFIEEEGNELLAASLDGTGGVDTRLVTEIQTTSGITLGDLAIDRGSNILYISTSRSDFDADGNDRGGIFFSIDLDDFSETLIAQGAEDEDAVRKQIAFEDREEGDNVLWAHGARSGDWWTVDLTTGALNEEDPVANTPTNEAGEGYSDLARCGFFEEPQEE